MLALCLTKATGDFFSTRIGQLLHFLTTVTFVCNNVEQNLKEWKNKW